MFKEPPTPEKINKDLIESYNFLKFNGEMKNCGINILKEDPKKGYYFVMNDHRFV